MLDLLLYFALSAIATIVIFTGLAWLTRPVRKVDKLEVTQQQEPQRIYYLKNPSVGELSFTGRLSDKDVETFQSWFTIEGTGNLNEDTRPMPAHEGSFSHDELWEAAAKMHRESQAQREQINKWEREMHENAGKE